MDIHELENPKLLTYQQIGLRIQLSAATLATSFLLIEIPNVETITLMCFLLGFLFKPRFAYSTVLTIVISWEVLATIIFAFSGITFPFKLFAWLIVCSLGIFARKIHVKSPIIFALFGFISALIYDILVTIPVAMLFLGNNTGFVTIYVSSFVFGLYFTLSHTLSNTLFFFFIPLLINNILLLLNLYFSSIVMIDDEYLNIDITTKETELIDGLNKLYSKRIIIYFLTLLIIVFLVIFSIQFPLNNQNLNDDEGYNGPISTNISIKYAGLLQDEFFELQFNQSLSVFSALLTIAVVNYTLYVVGSEESAFIDAINNVWNNENMSNFYWIYYINGARSNVGSSDYLIKNNDVIIWIYE